MNQNSRPEASDVGQTLNGASPSPPAMAPQRRFRRLLRQSEGATPPFARRRNQNGIAEPGLSLYPVPEPKILRQTYAEIIQKVEELLPAKAPLLTDAIDRVDVAYNGISSSRRQTGEELSLQNEEAAVSRTEFETRISTLEAERQKTARPYDDRISTFLKQKEDADARLVVARAARDAMEADADEGAAASPAAMPRRWGQVLKDSLRWVRPQAAAPVSAADVSLPFPMEEALREASPLEADAIDQGLLHVSPAARALRPNRVMAWLVLGVCGSIFGLSLGCLFGVIDPKAVAFNAARFAGPLAVCSGFGIALYWVLGRLVYGLAALTAQFATTALLNTHRDDPKQVGIWMRQAGRWGVALSGLILLFLITVESTVERFGLIKAFLAGAVNADVASRHAGAGHAGLTHAAPSPIAILCLTLIASAPFLLLYFAEGWADAHARCIRLYLEARLRARAYVIAKARYDEQVSAQVSAAAAKALADAQAAEAEKAALAAKSEGIGNVEDWDGTPPPLVEPPVRRVDLALAEVRAEQAAARLDQAHQARREAISWHDEKLQHLKGQLQIEIASPTASQLERLEDSYMRYEHAVRSFDRTYQTISAEVEKLQRRGVVWRFKGWLLRGGDTLQSPSPIPKNDTPPL